MRGGWLEQGGEPTDAFGEFSRGGSREGEAEVGGEGFGFSICPRRQRGVWRRGGSKRRVVGPRPGALRQHKGRVVLGLEGALRGGDTEDETVSKTADHLDASHPDMARDVTLDLLRARVEEV